MSNWSIEPAEIIDVLEKVNIVAGDLGSALEKLPGILESGVPATNAPPVADAVGELFDREANRIEAMNTRIEASATGIAESTTAYLEGDQEMAETAQRAAHQAVYPNFVPTSGNQVR